MQEQEGFGKQSSALKLKSSRGEIVEVQGGRILRSIGRKDRHSKVCTAKGPRDRRVRLSANTAIQFYDVQDRLGYGRPSEAIDWLMKEAKAAIDALAEKSPDQVPLPVQELEEQNNQCEFSNYGHEKQSHDEYLNQDPINSLSFFIPSSSSSPSTEFQNLNFESTPANWYQRTINFAANSTSGNGEGRGGGGGYVVTDTMPQWQQKVVLGQDQLFSQGGTLQSSYSPSFLALMNPQISSLNYDQMPEISPGTGNSFAVDGFSGFCASPRVRGEEERHHPVTNKPSSASCLLHFQD